MAAPGPGVVIALDVRGRARGQVERGARTRLVRQLGRAMQAAGCADEEVSLSLVDDEEIQTLNRAFRRKDEPTDVLSFSQREGQRVPGAGGLLGDIVISTETAARQAEAGGRGPGVELLHLAVHGLAHLLGYDHATLAEERVMFAFEAELRAQALGRGTVQPVEPPEWPPAKRARPPSGARAKRTARIGRSR